MAAEYAITVAVVKIGALAVNNLAILMSMTFNETAAAYGVSSGIRGHC